MEIPDLVFGPLMALLVFTTISTVMAGINILYRDKTIWYRITKQSWLWDVWKSPTNEIKVLAVLEKDIDTSDMTFGYRGGTYKLDPIDSNKNITEFSYKGRPAYIHTSGTIGPHAFTPHSLDSRMTPESLHACKDGAIRKQIDSIRVTDPIPKTSWFMIFLIVLAIVGIFAIYQVMTSNTSALNAILRALGHNSTSVSNQCPVGYVPTQGGACVPT